MGWLKDKFILEAVYCGDYHVNQISREERHSLIGLLSEKKYLICVEVLCPLETVSACKNKNKQSYRF